MTVETSKIKLHFVMDWSAFIKYNYSSLSLIPNSYLPDINQKCK
jgi:hypothetical protein